MKTPDYVMSEEYSYRYHWHSDPMVFSVGMFIRPIEIQYVPKHVTERETINKFDKDKEVYCFSRYGIYPIPLKLIRRV